ANLIKSCGKHSRVAARVTRIISAHLAVAMVAAGNHKCRKPSQLKILNSIGPKSMVGPRPPAGIQPNMTAKTMISIRPTQQLGNEKPNTEPAITDLAPTLLGRQPA